MSLEGKTALITGASRGIGQAIALELARRGATVIGTATSAGGAAKISDYIADANLKGFGLELNVCEQGSIDRLIAELKERGNLPAILVNNAAITADNIFLRMTPEQWSSVIETNLNSIYRMTRACLKPMFKARWGRVVNVTSVVGVAGNPGQANYCAAKAGVIGFGKALAQEMGKAGITVNAVAPGFIDTDMTRALNDAQRERIDTQIPMGRVGKVEEVAKAVAFLASDDASYITGQTLHVNGGMVMV